MSQGQGEHASPSDRVDRELIIGYEDSVTNLPETAQKHVPADASVRRFNEQLNLVLVEVPDSAVRTQTVTRLESQQAVKFAEPNSLVSADEQNPLEETVSALEDLTAVSPDDPEFDNQYGPQQVNAPAAWETTLGSDHVTISVLDTGIQYTHEELYEQMDDSIQNHGVDFAGTNTDYREWPPEDTDPYPKEFDDANHWTDPNNDTEEHGTQVAGIAAARTDNGRGVAGISNCTIQSVRVLGTDGYGTTYDIADGITWAVDHGADVINLSLGSKGEESAFFRAIGDASKRGVLTVGAAGNDGEKLSEYGPASQCHLAVSAVRSGDETLFWRWSNYGDYVDLTAPGTSTNNVETTYPCDLDTGGPAFDEYTGFKGTSMSAPIVSGVAALMLSVDYSLSVSDLVNVLRGTAKDVGLSSDQQGHGRVDAAAAVERVNADGTLKNTSVGTDSPYVHADDTVDASVTVENTGNYDHSYFLGYSVQGPDGVWRDNDEQTGTATKTLSPGETTTVSLEWKIESDAPTGTYKTRLTLWVEDTRETLQNNLFTVDTDTAFELTEPASFDVSVTGSNAPISEGKKLTVDAQVENTGGIEGSDTITFAVDTGDGFSQLDSTTVTLGGGETTTQTFNYQTQSGDADSVSVRLESSDTSYTSRERIASPVSGDWPMYQRDAQNTGDVSSVSGPVEQPIGAKWVNNRDTVIYPTLAVGKDNYTHIFSVYADGMIKAPFASGGFFADFTDGDFSDAGPAVKDDILIIGDSNGTIYGYSISNRDQLWSPYDTGTEITASPTILSNVVYVGNRAGEMYAININDGSIVWNTPIGDVIFNTAAVSDGYVFVSTGSNTLYALDAGTGSIEWSESLNGDGIVSPPSVNSGTVYVASERENDGKADVHAFDIDTGNSTWSSPFEVDGRVREAPAVDGNHVFVGSGEFDDGVVCAIDATDGQKTWSTSVDDWATTAPVVAVDTIYVATWGGTLYALEYGSGDEKWTYGLQAGVYSQHLLVDNTVYVADSNGAIHAVTELNPDQPIASFTYAPTDPTIDETVSFDGSDSVADGTIDSLDWSFGDDNGGSGETVDHSFDVADSYSVELTVTDEYGQTDTTTTTVSVDQGPMFDVTITSTSVGDGTVSVTYTAENSGDRSDTQDIIFEVDSSEVARSEVSLGPGSSTSKMFAYRIVLGDSPEVSTTVRTADASDSATVSVTAASFSLSVDGTNSPVLEGEPLGVTPVVTNTGDVPGSLTITLSDFDGNSVDTSEVTVEPGNDVLETLRWDTDAGDADEDTVTVSCESDQTRAPVEVAPPSDISVGGTGGSLDENREVAISLDGDYADKLTLSKLWADWEVVKESPDGALIKVETNPEGVYHFEWPHSRGEVAPQLTVSLPERYVGGTYGMDVIASNLDETTKTTIFVEL